MGGMAQCQGGCVKKLAGYESNLIRGYRNVNFVGNSFCFVLRFVIKYLTLGLCAKNMWKTASLNSQKAVQIVAVNKIKLKMAIGSGLHRLWL